MPKSNTQQSNDDKRPNPPTKPMSGFFIFKEEKRHDLEKAHPDAKLTQIVKIASEHWHKMSESDKKPYEDKYREAKEKYDQNKKAYEEKYGKIERKQKKSKAKKEAAKKSK